VQTSNIFKPVTKKEQHDLEQQFHHCQLTEDSANPDKWFAKLDNIRLQLKIDHGIELTEDKVITQILFNCKPTAYVTTIAMLNEQT
jgi:hypothetical protein